MPDRASADHRTPDPTPRVTAAIAAGDAEAFEAFYRDRFDAVLGAARRHSRRDEAFCLDVVQEAMLRAVRGMRTFEDAAALGAWLDRVVRTTVLDMLRGELRRAKRELAAATREPAIAPAALVERHEEVAWLEARLDELRPADRRLLVLRFLLGRTLEETARESGLSAHAVHGRVRRLIEKLRTRARRNFGDVL